MDKNEWLATKVMGWDVLFRKDSICGDQEYCFDKNGYRQFSLAAWNPRENIEQAFMLLDTFDETFYIEITKSDQLWTVEIHKEREDYPSYFKEVAEADSNQLSVAITAAVLKASGYHD